MLVYTYIRYGTMTPTDFVNSRPTIPPSTLSVREFKRLGHEHAGAARRLVKQLNFCFSLTASACVGLTYERMVVRRSVCEVYWRTKFTMPSLSYRLSHAYCSHE